MKNALSNLFRKYGDVPVAREPGEASPFARTAGYYVVDRKVRFPDGETIGTDANPMGRIRLDQTSVAEDSKGLLEEAKDV